MSIYGTYFVMFGVHVHFWLVDVADLFLASASSYPSYLISIGQDSDQKAKMVIAEKLHHSLEFVAPGMTVAYRGCGNWGIHREMMFNLQYSFVEGSKQKMSELG